MHFSNTDTIPWGVVCHLKFFKGIHSDESAARMTGPDAARNAIWRATQILRLAIILLAVIGALAIGLIGDVGRSALIVLWLGCGAVVGLMGGTRALIIVAAIIAGGYVAAIIADWYYGDLPGEWGMAAAQATIVVIMPAGAIVSGAIAALLTRKRKNPPVT